LVHSRAVPRINAARFFSACFFSAPVIFLFACIVSDMSEEEDRLNEIIAFREGRPLDDAILRRRINKFRDYGEVFSAAGAVFRPRQWAKLAEAVKRSAARPSVTMTAVVLQRCTLVDLPSSCFVDLLEFNRTMTLRLEFVTAENTRSRDASAGRMAAFAQLKYLFDHFRTHSCSFSWFRVRTDVVELATLLHIARPLLSPWITIDKITLEASHKIASASVRFRAFLSDLAQSESIGWVVIQSDPETSLHDSPHVADFDAMEKLAKHNDARLPRIDLIGQADGLKVVLTERVHTYGVSANHDVWTLPRCGSLAAQDVLCNGNMRAKWLFGVRVRRVEVNMERTCAEIVRRYATAQCIVIGMPRREPDEHW
jgi:hypothetical protein